MPWKPDHGDDFPTLGWELLDWWADFLPSPRDESEPLIFTDEQARILLEWYRLDPMSGQFVYRRGVSRRAKGWGKSPVEAAKNIAALAGPSRFDGWDASGKPVGRPLGTKPGDPPPWVQIAAVSEDQTENTYSVVHQLLNANDGAASTALRIDAGLTRCYLMDRPGKLEPVTASAGTREGQPVTDATMDETHLYLPRNGGVRLARTIRRNVAKMSGRSYETTNSFAPGEDSVAEATHKAFERGAPGVFCDAVEAPRVKEDDPDDVLLPALRVAYGDSWWVDLRRILADIRDPDMPWEDACRFNFNWNVDDRHKAVETKRWAELALPADTPLPPPGARIGLGFDGSISDDTTALRGCFGGLDGVPTTFELGVWRRPVDAPRGWRIPRRDVRQLVRESHAMWDVGRMLCDPAKWATEIEDWAEEFGEDRVVVFDTNQTTRMARACDRWLTAVAEGAYRHISAAVTTAHVLAMHKRKVMLRADDDDGRTKFVFVKGPDREKIDAGVADVLALEAFATMPVPVSAAVVPSVAFR